MFKNLTCNEPVSNGVQVDSIIGQPITGIALAGLGEESFQRTVDIDDVPACGSLVQEPPGVVLEHLVITLKRLAVFREARRERL